MESEQFKLVVMEVERRWKWRGGRGGEERGGGRRGRKEREEGRRGGGERREEWWHLPHQYSYPL